MVSVSRKAIFGIFYFGLLIRFRVSISGKTLISLSSRLCLSLPDTSLAASPSPAENSLLRPPQGTKPVPKCSPIFHLQSYTHHVDQIGVCEEKSQVENHPEIAIFGKTHYPCRRRFRPFWPRPTTGLCSPPPHEHGATSLVA